MAALNIMQAIVLFFGILVPSFMTTGAQPIGVCNGRNGNNLPSEQDTVRLYNDNGIGRMRIYDPLRGTLEALRGTNIELILDVPNTELESLQDPGAATAWVQDNILNYPDVQFRYISVGNEVDPDTDTTRYLGFVLPVMRNVHDAIVSAGLQDQIKVSTATYSGLIGPNSSPPSQGSFKDNAQGFMKPIIGYLAQNNLPLLANIYPYISYLRNPRENLEYALFKPTNVIVRDGNLEYKNLFDALLDVMYSAVEKLGGSNIKIVVSESGWPSEGNRGASVENAQTYYKNLIDHVRGNGTPKKPGTIETFLFAMFDENNKNGEETERHFGLFNPTTQQPKYQLNFS
ncbi:Acidic class II 1,3-beta-glucanase [Heracleum sosnowskyi]|uniref:Acidic class II 1,3-beta-glucanase n=1 Tax=Heracleum sosnowskyi TaxID=360622 RepID=A0AAD8HHA8_9APIA|nr:Acidic class II 1,3-beta-glucanase [Heracleum sosnowskyi]